MEALVSHGVGRVAAGRLAREAPDECRRQLEYLPFADIRTTPGAWLVSAVRHGYGPPAGYLRAREAAEAGRRARAAAQARASGAAWEAAERRRDQEVLAGRYQTTRAEGGDEWRDFRAFVDRERDRLRRVADLLSPGRRDERLRAFDAPGHQLELYRRWASGPRRKKAEDQDNVRELTGAGDHTGLG